MLMFLPYYGGKNLIGGWISQYVPDGGMPYCEPFAGSAGLLFRRTRAQIEVLNDIDTVLINAYRAVQSDNGTLQHMIEYTLNSRKEVERAGEIIKLFRGGKDVDRVSLAWAKIVAHWLGISGIESTTNGRWAARLRPKRSSFLRFKNDYQKIKRRLENVILENSDGVDCIKKWDNPDAVFYLDPPYLSETRKSKKVYAHETSYEDHKRIIEAILNCKGAVVISGYQNELYNTLEHHGWLKFTKKVICRAACVSRNSKSRSAGAVLYRFECLWANPRAQDMLIRQGKLNTNKTCWLSLQFGTDKHTSSHSVRIR